MNISILLLMVGVACVSTVSLEQRFNLNINKFLGRKKNIQLSVKQICLYIVFTFIMVMIVARTPEVILKYLYLGAITFLISLYSFLITNNRYALLIGLIYPILYFFSWNLFTFNLIAVIGGVGGTLFINKFIRTKYLTIMVLGIILIDVIHVLVTKDMITAATNVAKTQAPVMIASNVGDKGMVMGVGDVFFTSLVILKTTNKLGFTISDKVVAIILTCLSAYPLIIFSFGYLSALPATLMLIVAVLVSVIIVYFGNVAYRKIGGEIDGGSGFG